MSESRVGANAEAQALRTAIAKVKDSARLNAILSRLAFFSQPGEISASMAERLCSTDHTIGPLILRSLNEALAMKAHPPAESIGLAIQGLGNKQARRALTISSFGLWALFGLSKSSLNHVALTLQATAMGCVLSRFSKASEFDDCTMFAFGANIHIGIPLMNLVFRERYSSMWESLSGAGHSLFEAERDTFGIDHAEAGSILAQEFGFPKPLGDALALHHEPIANIREIPLLMNLSETISHQLGYDGGAANAGADFQRSWMIRMGIKESDLPEIAKEIEVEAGMIRRVLSPKAA